MLGIGSGIGANADSLDAHISELKKASAQLVASARPHLDSLSPQERIAAPPVIWRVPGALSEFSECAGCPKMVVVPAVEFTMGSPPAEQGAETQHRVTIAAPFAVGKFEVTFEEWDACANDGGCGGYRPSAHGFGRGSRPVMNVSWRDATAYVDWLRNKTGKPYRLLSEAEWEYAARAGTTTIFYFGNEISPDEANFDASTDGSGPSEINQQRTMPVGSFPPNAFGLHDMHGNVAEWVEDCWHDDYAPAAPADGSAWLSGNCNGRVVRGGSWGDSQSELRSAARTGGYRDDQFDTTGFRVARSL
jgi:formylglycine-generating enzyme required for sulfatase activity